MISLCKSFYMNLTDLQNYKLNDLCEYIVSRMPNKTCINRVLKISTLEKH